MTRACANCEAEAGILNRADSTKTHGLCHRHFVSVLLVGGIDRTEIDGAIAGMTPGAFCPDLSMKEAA